MRKRREVLSTVTLRPRLLTALTSVLASAIYAQAAPALDKSEYIDTNRPSFCQSAFTVPSGTIQLENGTEYRHFQHGITVFDIPENQVRIGIRPKTEFQMFTPNAIVRNQGNSTLGGTTGLTELGFKQQFGPYKHFTASIVAALNVPTGRKSFSGTAVQPVFRIPYGLLLNPNWALCGMQSIIVTGNGNIQWQPFVMVNRNIGNRAAAFIEYAGFFQQNSHAPGQSIAHCGAVYKLNRHHQIDTHFGFGLSKTAPSAFVGAGYSYRFDNLPWGK